MVLIRAGWAALAVVVVLAVGGCARGEGAGEAGLNKTADQAQDLLRSRYARWYASMTVDESSASLTIYRKPGSDLDRVVRNRLAGVNFRFAEARLTEREMLALTERVVADREYWRGKGIAVAGAGPTPDGSAVRVMTVTAAPGEEKRLSEHYGQPIVVEQGCPVFAPYSVGPSGVPSGPTGK